MYNQVKKTFVGIIVMVFCTIQSGIAQIGVEIESNYEKLIDQSIRITAVVADTEEYDPVAGMTLECYSKLENDSVMLGSAMTDEEGKALFEQIPFSQLLLDEQHRFSIYYSTKQKDYYLDNAPPISFIDPKVDLSFESVDDKKNIVVGLYTWDLDGQEVPFPEQDAYLFVPRLFGLLPIGEIYTEDNGIGEIKFPLDLPGDANGEVSVIVQLQDHELFGNVSISKKIDWAVPTGELLEENARSLSSTQPPLWMVISFAVLMIGVWFHYGWVIYNMMGIKSAISDDDRLVKDLYDY